MYTIRKTDYRKEQIALIEARTGLKGITAVVDMALALLVACTDERPIPRQNCTSRGELSKSGKRLTVLSEFGS